MHPANDIDERVELIVKLVHSLPVVSQEFGVIFQLRSQALFEVGLHEHGVFQIGELSTDAVESGVNVNTLLSRKRYAVLHLRERLQTIHDQFTKK